MSAPFTNNEDRTTSHADRPGVIRNLNDRFRRTFSGGLVVMTPGVESLDMAERQELLSAVRRFDGFDEGNDPYREHDFGAVEIGGVRFMWKIEYYDLSMNHASPDPADPAVTCRVMTIMCADEY